MNHSLLSVGFELCYLHVSQKGEKALELHPCSVFAISLSLFHINRTTVWSCILVVDDRTQMP